MDKIDYFKGVTNQDFIDYYKVDLYSRMEITIYTYPHEFVEEDPIPWEHFNRCERILYDYLYNAYADAEFQRRQQEKNKESENPDKHDILHAIEQTADEKAAKYAAENNERESIVKAKMLELVPELSKLTDDYLQNVKLTFVDL